MLVKVDPVVVGNQSPDPDIKLPPIEQEGMLNVLLHDPGLCLRIPMKNEIIDFLKIAEQLNAFALVERCRLHKPHILSAVLHGHALSI